jgi:hypothetical protein
MHKVRCKLYGTQINCLISLIHYNVYQENHEKRNAPEKFFLIAQNETQICILGVLDFVAGDLGQLNKIGDHFIGLSLPTFCNTAKHFIPLK